MISGPSSSRTDVESTPKLGKQYFDKTLCYAPADDYIRRSTPRGEPDYVTAMRKEAYLNGLNAGSFLFIPPAVSQAAACNGTIITTSADGQNIAPGTLPTF